MDSAEPRCAIRHDFHRGDEAVAAAGNRLNESRIIGRIAQGVAQLVHRRVEAVVVIDERVRGPKQQPQFVPRHHVAGMGEKVQENLERLPLQARAQLAVLAQFARAAVQLVQAEAENGFWIGWFRHRHLLTHGIRRSF